MVSVVCTSMERWTMYSHLKQTIPNINSPELEDDILIHMFECKNKEQKPEEKIVFKTDYIYKKTITFGEFKEILVNSSNETEFFKGIKKLLTH